MRKLIALLMLAAMTSPVYALEVGSRLKIPSDGYFFACRFVEDARQAPFDASEGVKKSFVDATMEKLQLGLKNPPPLTPTTRFCMPLLPLTYVVTKKSDDGHLCIDGINPSGKVTTAFCVWIKETALMPAPVAIPTAESTKSQPPVSKEKSIADGVAGAMMYMRDCDQNAFSSRSARRSLELMNVRYAAAIEAALESLEAVFRKWTQENHGDKSTSAVAGWCAMVKPDMIKLEHEVSGVLP